jgi:quercetin dioxygenase-like cupin family protein
MKLRFQGGAPVVKLILVPLTASLVVGRHRSSHGRIFFALSGKGRLHALGNVAKLLGLIGRG